MYEFNARILFISNREDYMFWHKACIYLRDIYTSNINIHQYLLIIFFLSKFFDFVYDLLSDNRIVFSKALQVNLIIPNTCLQAFLCLRLSDSDLKRKRAFDCLTVLRISNNEQWLVCIIYKNLCLILTLKYIYRYIINKKNVCEGYLT